MIKNNEEFIVHNVNKKEQKAREGNIEVLRFILCIFVILIHSFDGNFIFPFTYGAVSCFAMISGFFMVKSNDNFKFLRFLPVLFFLLVTNFIITVIFHFILKIKYGLLIFKNTSDWLRIAFFGSNSFWYM